MTDYVYFDIEANGLSEDVSKVHCLVMKTPDGEVSRYSNDDVKDGVGHLMVQMTPFFDRTIVAHNGINYDCRVLAKLYPWFKIARIKVEDTLVLSRLIYPDIYRQLDEALLMQNKIPPKLAGSHSLEAWGYRLGEHKAGYEGGWEEWSQEMEDYCAQDVEVLAKLHAHLHAKKPGGIAVELEHEVAWILMEQEQRGVQLNEKKAVKLYTELLGKKLECERLLKEEFGRWYESKGRFTPKKDHKRFGYIEGVEFTKIELVEFNPGSRQHIAKRLQKKYNWIPKQFTPTGHPEINEKVIEAMVFPCKKLLAEYLKVTKLIGMISEGDNAWLKLMDKDGVIHGKINPNGAVTGRATHSNPNLGQVPKVGSSWGAECRELFEARIRKVMAGCDGAGLELRCLGHRMAPYDDGAFGRAVIEGKAEDGTDVHSLNTVAIGFNPKEVYSILGKQTKGRDIAKTFIYAFLYGAGDEKIGSIVGEGPGKGKKLKAQFLAKTPALKKLLDAVKTVAKERGWIKGLDGRRIPIRSAHSALNTLLQSDGAILAKMAMVILYRECRAREWDAHQLLWVHDEFQYEIDPEIADEWSKVAVGAWEEAGRRLGYRVPITGEAKIGSNWKETH